MDRSSYDDDPSRRDLTCNGAASTLPSGTRAPVQAVGHGELESAGTIPRARRGALTGGGDAKP